MLGFEPLLSTSAARGAALPQSSWRSGRTQAKRRGLCGPSRASCAKLRVALGWAGATSLGTRQDPLPCRTSCVVRRPPFLRSSFVVGRSSLPVGRSFWRGVVESQKRPYEEFWSNFRARRPSTSTNLGKSLAQLGLILIDSSHILSTRSKFGRNLASLGQPSAATVYPFLAKLWRLWATCGG